MHPLWYVLIGLACLIVFNRIRKWIRNKKKRDLKIENHQNYLNSIKQSESKKPNIIIFFMDDMGFADISCYGATNIHTPNIDSLAENGVKFTAFYSSSPVCSPSRAGLLTGRHPLRMHVSNVYFPNSTVMGFLINSYIRENAYGVLGLMEDEITIPEVLKRVGYTTGMLGKWHLGDKSPHLPNNKGFDFFYGVHYSNDMIPYAIWRNKEIEQPAPADQNNLTKSLTREGVNFIRENKDTPFFLHYCQPFPHNPLHASEEFRGTSRGGLYGDTVQEVDWSVGEILKTLNELNLRENTLIMFTSDNGPWHEGNPGYHRGRKGLPFEGGQRVPFIASFPSVIPKGIEVDEMAMNTDIFPTILNILGISLPKDRIYDGKNIVPLIEGSEKESPHKYLYYHWGKKILAVRNKNYKYHTRHKSDNSTYTHMKIRPCLYDMKSYDQESYDQVTHHPKEAVKLKAKLEEFQNELKRNPRGWISNPK